MAAQIVQVDPPGAKVSKFLADRQERPVGLNDLVCVGETLEFRSGGARRVVLYVEGRKRVLSYPETFQTNAGAIRFATSALSFLTDAIQGTKTIRPPPEIPNPTVSRGTRVEPAQLVLQIRAMRLLHENLPRQSIAIDQRPLLSWRHGTEPYECEAISELGDVVWSSANALSTSWCELPANLTEAVQLRVRDAKGRVAFWNIRRVEWAAVPRPRWIASDPSTLSNEDRAAWGWWLWKEGGEPWRMQALAMLNEVAPKVWVAGYLRDNLLSESVEFAP